MAATLDERFETATTGYEEVWVTPAPTGGSTVAPATINANAPALWEKQSCVFTVGSGTSCYIIKSLVAAPITFTSFESALISDNMADNQFCYTALAINVAQPLWFSYYTQIAGALFHVIFVYLDGVTPTAVCNTPVTPFVFHRYEVKWDSTADVYQVWVDGVSQAQGSLSGAAATTSFLSLAAGCWSATGVNAATYAMDLIRTDNAARPIDGVGGGALHQQYYRNLVQE